MLNIVKNYNFCHILAHSNKATVFSNVPDDKHLSRREQEVKTASTLRWYAGGGSEVGRDALFASEWGC